MSQITAFGQTKTIAEWSRDKRCVVNAGALYARLNRMDISPEDAISKINLPFQQNDKRLVRITAFGLTKTISEWAQDKRCPIKASALYARLKAGITPEDAIAKKKLTPRPKRKPRTQITAFGDTMTITEWSRDERCVVSSTKLSERLKAGITPEDAISKAVLIPRRRTEPPIKPRLIIAWGEQKTVKQWSEDPRCAVNYETLKTRFCKGSRNNRTIYRNNPEMAISQPLLDIKPITAFNEKKSIAEWARDARCVVDYQVLCKRIQYGFHIENSITKPNYELRLLNNNFQKMLALDLTIQDSREQTPMTQLVPNPQTAIERPPTNQKTNHKKRQASRPSNS